MLYKENTVLGQELTEPQPSHSPAPPFCAEFSTSRDATGSPAPAFTVQTEFAAGQTQSRQQVRAVQGTKRGKLFWVREKLSCHSRVTFQRLCIYEHWGGDVNKSSCPCWRLECSDITGVRPKTLLVGPKVIGLNRVPQTSMDVDQAVGSLCLLTQVLNFDSF